MLSAVNEELYRLRTALLDPRDPNRERYWAAQQALAWITDPENFAPPFSAIRGSEAEPKGC